MITVASNFGSLAARQPALGLSKHHPHKDQIHWLGWDSSHKIEGHVDGLDELSEEDIMWGDEVQDQHKMMQHHHYHIHQYPHHLHQPQHHHAPAERRPIRSLLTAEMERALSNNNGDTGPQYSTARASKHEVPAGPKAPQGPFNHALQASIYDASSSSTSALLAAGNSKHGAHDVDDNGDDADDDGGGVDADDGFHVNQTGHEVDQASKHKFKHGQEGGGDHVLVPPHEMLARKYASSSFSVLQGTGRTLKGMDLRRMRNAVWMRTGFVD